MAVLVGSSAPKILPASEGMEDGVLPDVNGHVHPDDASALSRASSTDATVGSSQIYARSKPTARASSSLPDGLQHQEKAGNGVFVRVSLHVMMLCVCARKLVNYCIDGIAVAHQARTKFLLDVGNLGHIVAGAMKISEAAIWYGLRMLERAGGGVRQTIKPDNAYERRLLSEVIFLLRCSAGMHNA